MKRIKAHVFRLFVTFGLALASPAFGQGWVIDHFEDLSGIQPPSAGRYQVTPETPPSNLVYYTNTDNSWEFAHQWTDPAAQVAEQGTIVLPMTLTAVTCPTQGGKCVGGYGWSMILGAQESVDCVNYADDNYLVSPLTKGPFNGGYGTHVNADLLQSATTAYIQLTPFYSTAQCIKVFLSTGNGGVEGGVVGTYYYTRVGHQHLPPPVPNLLSPANNALVDGTNGVQLVWAQNGSTSYGYQYYLRVYQYNFQTSQYQVYDEGYQSSDVILPKGIKGYFAWEVLSVDTTYGDINGHFTESPFLYFTAQ